MTSNWPSTARGGEHPTCCWALFSWSATPEFSPISHPHPLPTFAPRPPQTANKLSLGATWRAFWPVSLLTTSFLSPKGIICSPHFSCLIIHNPRNVTSKHHHHTDTHLSFLTDLSSSILLFNSCPLISRKFLSPVSSPLPVHFSCVLREPIRVDMF